MCGVQGKRKPRSEHQGKRRSSYSHIRHPEAALSWMLLLMHVRPTKKWPPDYTNMATDRESHRPQSNGTDNGKRASTCGLHEASRDPGGIPRAQATSKKEGGSRHRTTIAASAHSSQEDHSAGGMPIRPPHRAVYQPHTPVSPPHYPGGESQRWPS